MEGGSIEKESCGESVREDKVEESNAGSNQVGKDLVVVSASTESRKGTIQYGIEQTSTDNMYNVIQYGIDRTITIHMESITWDGIEQTSTKNMRDGSQNDIEQTNVEDIKGVAKAGKEQTNTDKTRGGIQYGIEDCPPWHITILLGFQHYLLLFSGSVTVPLLITPAMCIGDDDVGKSEVISTVFFVEGLATLLQTIFGSRLPIVQGGAFAFITPILAVLALPRWKCPDGPPDMANLTSIYGTSMGINDTLLAWRRDVWTSRMREIQGSIAVASIVQIVLALSGILSFIVRYIGPLCVGPTIIMIGLSLYGPAANYCGQHWGIAFLTISLFMLFSQYLRDVQVPVPSYSKVDKCHIIKYPLFKLLPVIFTIVIVWSFCAILTITNVFPSDPSVRGYAARIDVKLKVLDDAKWFKFPYPGQWGMPTASAGAVVGMSAAIVVGIIKAISDYSTIARLSGAPSPPTHAINRGIFIEGIGIACCGVWGGTSGVTSYSQNLAAIGITKVASRRVIQVGAIIAMILAVFGKFGALFVTIPDPIFGGIFMMVFGLIAAMGVSSMQHVDLNSSRNLFVFGFSILLGLSLPNWIRNHPNAIDIGYAPLDQVFFVLLNTPMLIAGVMGFVLDNTIPGTPEERGLVGWRGIAEEMGQENKSPYDLPFGIKYLRKAKWLRFFPICPTYEPTCACCARCQPRRSQVHHNK